MGKNSCKTYFSVTGDFNPDTLTKVLEIEPFSQHNKTDVRRDGKPYGFSTWRACLCDTYDVYTTNQMEKTIQPLLGKTELLKMLSREGKLELFLAVVPHVYVGESTPCLAPSMKVMEFCVQTGTQIDVDMYAYNSEEE